jgi:hypothetical protein
MLLNRRGLITGLASLVAAPAIVRASSLMPVKAWDAIHPLQPDLKMLEINQWLEECKRRIMEAMIYPPRIVSADGMDLGALRVNADDFRLVLATAQRS